MKTRLRLSVVICLVAAPLLALAGAQDDVLILAESRSSRTTTYELISHSDLYIVATVEYTARCGGPSEGESSDVHDYVVEPGGREKLREVRAESSCNYSFTVIAARYL